MRSFEEFPRVPVTRLLGQIFATGARRYEMREMQALISKPVDGLPIDLELIG